jgi:D-alanyl-D-alanine carboxypeptidase
VIALQLADEGLLDLHAPVTDYVRWLSLRSRFAPVTAHHLLTHTAGVVESSDLAPASTYDVIALAGTEPGFSPAEHRHYSNIGYRAVGVLLEAVTGRPYEELVKERVLDRLGLESSHAVMVHDTRRLLPGGNVPFYDDRPGTPSTGSRLPPGSSPPRPTVACAAPRRIWPPTCASSGPEGSSFRRRASPR